MKAIKSLSVTAVIVFSLYLCACGASTEDAQSTTEQEDSRNCRNN